MFFHTSRTTFETDILKLAEITAEKKHLFMNVNAREKQQNSELEKSLFGLMKSFSSAMILGGTCNNLP